MVVVEVKGKFSNKRGDHQAAEVQVDTAVGIDADDNGNLFLRDASGDVVQIFGQGRWWTARLLKDKPSD